METSSRVKKYENLRQEILEDNKENVEAPKLSRFAKRLSNIDADYFQPIVENYEKDIIKEPIMPQRARQESKLDVEDIYYNEQEILARALRISDSKENSSDDELLNSFLKEIRTYNQKQGVRSLDDTKLEILKQVKVESETQETNTPSEQNVKDSIAKQVKDLLNKEPFYATEEYESTEVKPIKTEEVSDEPQVDYTPAPVIIKSGGNTDRYEKLLNEEKENRAKILEETQQLRLKLSEHEDELDEIGTGIDYTRRLLNVLLGLLLVTVLIAGGILAYLVMRG